MRASTVVDEPGQDLDLDRPASLHWHDVAAEDLEREPGWHACSQDFETVRAAVRFCIEELDLRLRNFAWLQITEDDRIEPAEIEALYTRLGDD